MNVLQIPPFTNFGLLQIKPFVRIINYHEVANPMMGLYVPTLTVTPAVFSLVGRDGNEAFSVRDDGVYFYGELFRRNPNYMN